MSEVIRLAVLGAGGRMGRAVVALGREDPRFDVTAVHARAGSCDLPTGVIVSDNLQTVVNAADVAIDFTRPEFTGAIIAACTAARRALVCGTTGMDVAQRQALEAAGRDIPVLWAPNMSVGVNLLLAALAQVADRLGEEYDAEIVEAHHRHKVDAPSGTALALGEVVAAARGRTLAELASNGHSGVRTTGSIGFHAVRAGEIVGEHDVRLVSASEEIRLGHSAFSRNAFASGALRAAAWLHGRANGFYGMRDVLDLS